jgi:hypothetical protein
MRSIQSCRYLRRVMTQRVLIMLTYLHGEDHESFLLERPLKYQGLATEEITENIPCGPTNKEVYASMDWVDMYMTDMDTL